MDFLQEAEALRDMLVARRRDLHRQPELAFEEVRTAQIVAEELASLGLEVRTGIGQTGVVGLLEGDTPGPTVLVRADMDALPVQEENCIDHASQVAGKMHACGHDAHVAIALGVARLLTARRDQLAGRVKFVFQPAEEIGRGAAAMIADGVLDDPRPDVSLGLHVWNGLPVGRVGVADGPVMAGASVFDVRVTGKGAHAAMPHDGLDPVACAVQIISAYQTIISRNLDPLKTAVLSVTYVRAGSAHNVIPGDAEIKGTIRTFDLDVREMIVGRMTAITESVAVAMGCEATLEMHHRTEPVVNHPAVSQRLRARFAQMLGPDALVMDERTLAGEDMALFMRDIPGMFFFVGSAPADPAQVYGHHHPRFDIDEAVLPLAAGLLATAAAEYVLPGG